MSTDPHISPPPALEPSAAEKASLSKALASIFGVNSQLSRDPTLFPLDAPWVTMHHDKGQLGRSTPAWMGPLFEARLAAGESPVDLAVQCWIMTVSGMNHGLASFDQLVALAPEAAIAITDPQAALPALARAAEAFKEASLHWTAPTDMALRGWSKIRTDAVIESTSKTKFAHIATCCESAARIGLPAVLLLAARSDRAWLTTSRPDGSTEYPAALMPQYLNSHGALGLMIRARQSQITHGGAPDRAAIEEVLALCCQGLSPKNFRVALGRMCPDPWDKCRQGAHAVATSVFLARSELDAFETEQAAFHVAEAKRLVQAAKDAAKLPIDPDEDHGFEDEDEYCDGFDTLTREKVYDENGALLGWREKIIDADAILAKSAMAARARDFELRHERARDTLAHLGNWALNADAEHGGIGRAFFEAALGCSLSDPQANARANAILMAARGGRLKLSVFALGLAQAARDAGHPIEALPLTADAVWRSHLQAFSRLPTGSIPKHFPQRHLALASYFPHEALEGESLKLAPGPMLALIEDGILSAMLARHVPDMAEPGMDSDEEQEPPAPARKLRL